MVVVVRYVKSMATALLVHVKIYSTWLKMEKLAIKVNISKQFDDCTPFESSLNKLESDFISCI